jgi:hypothetical protein
VYCHRVTTQLQLINISYHIISVIVSDLGDTELVVVRETVSSKCILQGAKDMEVGGC